MRTDERGFLLTTDHSGHIRVVGIRRFEIVTGQKIDPADCAGDLNKDAFEASFQVHLIWAVDEMIRGNVLCGRWMIKLIRDYNHSNILFDTKEAYRWLQLQMGLPESKAQYCQVLRTALSAGYRPVPAFYPTSHPRSLIIFLLNFVSFCRTFDA